MTLTLALSACATAANRRALYYPNSSKGAWTDYEKRREAEAKTGISLASTTTTTTTMMGPPTPMPHSKPMMGPKPTAAVPAIPPPATADIATTPDAAPTPAPDATPAAPPAQ